MDINHPLRDVPSDVGLLMKRTPHGTDIPRCYCYASKAMIALYHTTAEEQPEEHHKELKASTWPQNVPNPKLTELRGKLLNIFNPLSALGVRGSAVSPAVICGVFSRTLYSNHDHCHLFHLLVFLM